MKVKILNFKGLHQDTFDVDPHTLIIGPNGSGKSRILEAVMFALTGQVPGLSASAMWVYGVEDEITLVEVDDGDVVVTRSFVRAKNRVTKQTLETTPEGLDLPDPWAVDSTAFFAMGPKQQRQSILGMLLEPGEIANTVKSQFDLAGAGDLYSPPAPEEDIPTWLERLGKELSAVTKSRKEDVASMEARLKPLADAGIPTNPQAALSEVTAKIEHLRQSLHSTDADLRERVKQVMSDLSRARKTVADIEAQGITQESLDADRARLQELQATTITIPDADLRDAERELYHLEAELKAKKEAGKGMYRSVRAGSVTCPILHDTCPASDQVIGSLKKTLAGTAGEVKRLQAEITDLRVKIDSLTEAVNKARKQEEERQAEIVELTARTNRHEALLATKAQAERDIERLQKQLDAMPLIPDEDDGTAQAIRDQIKELEAEKSRLEETARHKSDYDAMVNMLAEFRQKHEAVKAARRALKKVETDKVSGALRDVLTRAGGILHGVIDATLSIGQARGSITWALERGGQKTPVEALSQGERAIVSAAILTALWEVSGQDLSAVLLEAAEIDDENLVKVLTLLGRSSIRYVLVATCHEPVREVEGWQILTLG